MSSEKLKWDQKYKSTISSPPVAEVLGLNAHLLPEDGNALDLACGLGTNSVFLAQAGLNVCAWDISEEAINRVKVISEEKNVRIDARVRDVTRLPPQANEFDVIVVTHFLDRALCDDIFRALRLGGLLFYQTFTQDRVSNHGPSNPEYLLAANELLKRYSDMRILVYREEGTIGDIAKGWRDKAMLVAQKMENT